MRGSVKKTARFLGIIFGVWLALRFALPLLLPFFLGYAAAAAAEPAIRFLTRRFRLPRAAAVWISLTGILAGLSALAAVFCGLLFRQLGALTRFLPNLEHALLSGSRTLQTWLLIRIARLPGNLRPLLERSVGAFFSDSTALVTNLLQAGLSWAGKGLSGLPDGALTLGTAGIAAFLISFRMPRLRGWIRRRISPERLEALKQQAATVRQALGCWFSAQVRLTGITLGILLSGFFLLRLPNAPILAVLIALIDALPVLGSGSVLLPWAVVCLIQRSLPRAVGLIGIWVTAAVSRSALEPRLVGARLGLDPLAALVAMYAGFRIWGLPGMVLMPLIAACAEKLSTA